MRRRTSRGSIWAVAVAAFLLGSSCGPAPETAAPPNAEPALLVVPAPVLEAWAIGPVRWSADGSRLVAPRWSQMAGSEQVAILDVNGARVADLDGFDAAWVDADTLLVGRNLPGGLGGSVALAQPGRPPDEITDASSWILAGPPGVNAADGGVLPPGTSFRLLLGITPGPIVRARGWPAAFSGDGSRLAVVHPALAASGIVFASTGSASPGWIEVLSVPGLEPVAAFPDAVIDARLGVVVDRTGRHAAATSVRDGTVILDIESESSRVEPGACCPIGWTALGGLVTGPFAEGPILLVDTDTGASSRLAIGTRASVSPDDRVAVASGDGGRTLLILRGDRVLARAGFAAPIGQMAWRPDGRMLAITVRGDGPPERLVLLPVPDLP